jgi:alpha-tubulin suppressor-like RCC1 family protein
MRQLIRSIHLLGLPALLAGCGSDNPAAPGDTPGLTIETVDTAPRAGAPLETLADSVAVRVLDPAGAPFVNVRVQWTADRGGSVSHGLGFTDADGIARASWKLGRSEGTQTLRARVGLMASAVAATAEVEGWRVRLVSGSNGDHQCAIDLAGKAWCWGYNASGQLGNGTLESQASPAPVAPDAAFTSIVTGSAHTCGLAAGGSVYCWGGNSNGQLGDGSVVSRPTPTPIAAPAGLVFKSVVTGPRSTCALTDAGAAWCWGENRSRMLGTGSTARQVSLPAPMTGSLVFRNISLSDDRTCGVTHARAVYCTGRAEFLQMTGPDLATPTLIPFAAPADTVALSVWDQCALFFRSVTCWGVSYTDQTRVPANILTMSVGQSSWFGLGADGQGYFWGTTGNWPGGLGQAVPFEGGLTLSAVGSNDQRPCAIEAGTGILFCWSALRTSGNISGWRPPDPVATRPPT